MGGALMEVEIVRHFRSGDRDLRPGERVPLSLAESWRNWDLLREARMVRLVEARPGPKPASDPKPEPGRRKKEASA